MKKLLCFVAVAASAFLSSCSSDDNNNNTPEETQVTSIVLSSNIATVQLGAGAFTFNVADQTGRSLTNDADITVNNVTIDGNTFTPTEAGTFTVKATYQTFTSNTLTVTVTPAAQPEPEPTTENMFKINDGEPVITNNSFLVYAGTQQNINIWAVLVSDGDGNNIDEEPDNYGGIIFTTIQPEGQQELAYPTAGNITYNGGQIPGIIQAQFKTFGTNGTDGMEISSEDMTTALNLNLMEINTTASNWKLEYNLELQDGTKVNGFFNGNYNFIDDGELERKSNNPKVMRLSPAKIKQNINRLLKK